MIRILCYDDKNNIENQIIENQYKIIEKNRRFESAYHYKKIFIVHLGIESLT